MSSFRYMALVAIVLLLAVVALTVQGTPPPSTIGEIGENWDRKVDRAALLAQKEAISKFTTLAKKYEGTTRELAILIRLIEAQEVASNLEFRIAHGEAHQKKTPVNLTAYHHAISKMIDFATRAIARQPNFEEIVRAYFARAYGYSELKQIAAAKKDYEFLTVKFSETAWAIRGNLALADFAVNERDYRRAIYFLKRVEAKPQDAHYPIALYSLAWAYFNVHDVPSALSYVRRNVFYYRDKRENDAEKFLSTTEKSLWEHSLRDAVTFYFEGFDKQHPDFGSERALSVFRKLDPGDYLGNMAVLFAKLLRSRDHAKELNDWKSQNVEEESPRPETLDIVMTNFEYLSQRRNYDGLVAAAMSFKTLDEKTNQKMRKAPSYPAAQALILQTADAMQKSITSEADSKKAHRMSQVLAGIYEAFTAIVDDSDPRLLQIHYNLAETLYKIRDYENATREYVWVIDRWSRKSPIKLMDVRLKAISSRYQLFSKQGRLPQQLKPQEVTGSSSPDLGDLDKDVGEWISWVDAYLSDFGRTPTAFEEFEFESDRILYDKKQTKAAIYRLKKFVKERPATKTAVAAASLTLDTFVANALWSDALETSELFLSLPQLGDAEYRKQLGKIPGDSYLKIIEEHYKKEAFSDVTTHADRFLAKYLTSTRVPEVLFLAGLAAQKNKDSVRARGYLTDLLKKYPQNENRSNALLARANLAEAEYDFDGALEDYEESLSPRGKKAGDVAAGKRFFFLSWMARKPKPLDCSPYAKDDELRSACDRHRALIFLEQKKAGVADDDLVQKGFRGIKENRAVWAAVALTLAKKLPFKDKMVLSSIAASGWGDLDPLVQFALIRTINQRIPEVFSDARKSISAIARLKGDSVSLARRVELMREIETTAGKVVKLPWAKVKVAVLTEIAEVYREFCQELARLSPPKGTPADEAKAYRKTIAEILDPFDKKGKAIKAQADEIAKELTPESARQPAAKEEPLDLALLDKVALPAGWSTLVVDAMATPENRMRAYWVEAFRSQSWGRMGYFLQELKEKEIVKEPSLTLLRAVSLSLAGARSEALAEWERVRGDFVKEVKP